MISKTILIGRPKESPHWPARLQECAMKGPLFKRLEKARQGVQQLPLLPGTGQKY